ncbi:Diacetylchitobiose deacetylase [uncultured archaeon]|nr:Diacetylchitobiose deacetylase [uncultured archaeon]
MNILAIGAHPDDVELGCGGTISKHLLIGDVVYVLILTNGEKGNHDLNKQECFNSLEKLGINRSNVLFGNFSDGFVVSDQKLIDFMEKKINELNIERVYCHYPYDRHQDHRNSSTAASSAARKIPTLLLYQGPSTSVDFEPHYFIDISPEMLSKKINALSCYESQTKKNIINLEWVRSLAVINGMRVYTKYAEAFALNHMVEGGGKNV